MNLDVIRKIEKEAHDKIWNADVNSEDFPNSFNVEFCKLIVEECARLADANYNSGFAPVGEDIRNHFGVK